MALSATITLNPTTVDINQKVSAALVVSNSGAGAVNLLSVNPVASFTGSSTQDHVAVALGSVPLSSGFNATVPASGSLNLAFDCVFFGPSTGPSGLGMGTYSVSAICYGADGSVFSPTAATVTVNPLPLPSSEL